MLNLQTKNKNKFPKIQSFKFYNSLNKFGRGPPLYKNFASESVMDFFQRRCRLKLSPLYGHMLMKTKKTHQNLKFHNSFLNNVGRDPSYESTWILGSECSALSQEMLLNFVPPIWSQVKENAKKWKTKNALLERYLSPKFGINSFDGVRENWFHERTDDGHLRDDTRSAVK